MKLLIERFRDYTSKEEDNISALEDAPLISETVKEYYEFDPSKPQDCDTVSKMYGSPAELQKCIDEELKRVEEYFKILYIDDYNKQPSAFSPVQTKSIKYWAELMGFKEEDGKMVQSGPSTMTDDQRKSLVKPVVSRHKKYVDSQAKKDTDLFISLMNK